MKRHAPEEPPDDAPLFCWKQTNPREMYPPSNGTQTSKAAATSVESRTSTMRGQILAFIRSAGATGCTREAIEIALEMRGSTVRPRVVELLKFGTIREAEATRATSSGRQAVVLVAT